MKDERFMKGEFNTHFLDHFELMEEKIEMSA